ALRKHRVTEREGSLPPTIAAAMAFLANPRDTDAALDPVCGSGTLLAELHAYAPGAALTGIDLDRRAIATARRNLAHLPPAHLARPPAGTASPRPRIPPRPACGRDSCPCSSQPALPASSSAADRRTASSIPRSCASWSVLAVPGAGARSSSPPTSRRCRRRS